MRVDVTPSYIYPMANPGDFDPDTLAGRVQKRLDAVGLSARAASIEAGLGDSFIKNIFNGASKNPRTDTLSKLARVLKTSAEWLAHGQGPEEVSGYVAEPNAIPEQGPFRLPDQTGPRDIEELGITVGGDADDDSAFEFNGQVIDYVRRPVGILNRKDVFALRISNRSMEPKYEDGERVYVEKRKPAIRDYVVIELKPIEEGRPGKSFIKRLIAMDAARVTVEQFNPRGLLEFGRNEIKQILRVIPERELRGD